MAPKMRSSNVLRYIESAGLSEDLSEFESENVSAGSRLATKNETAVHVESTARLYELRLIQMEKFAIREKDTAILFGENSRPFRAATIKTFLEYLGEPKGTKIGSLACKGLAPPSIKGMEAALRFWMPKFGHVGPYSEQVKRDHDGKIVDIIPKGNPMEDAGVKTLIRSLNKRKRRPSRRDMRAGMKPYEAKKAPPFSRGYAQDERILFEDS